jgi:hypothetical protein
VGSIKDDLCMEPSAAGRPLRRLGESFRPCLKDQLKMLREVFHTRSRRRSCTSACIHFARASPAALCGGGGASFQLEAGLEAMSLTSRHPCRRVHSARGRVLNLRHGAITLGAGRGLVFAVEISPKNSGADHPGGWSQRPHRHVEGRHFRWGDGWRLARRLSRV